MCNSRALSADEEVWVPRFCLVTCSEQFTHTHTHTHTHTVLHGPDSDDGHDGEQDPGEGRVEREHEGDAADDLEQVPTEHRHVHLHTKQKAQTIALQVCTPRTRALTPDLQNVVNLLHLTRDCFVMACPEKNQTNCGERVGTNCVTHRHGVLNHLSIGCQTVRQFSSSAKIRLLNYMLPDHRSVVQNEGFTFNIALLSYREGPGPFQLV